MGNPRLTCGFPSQRTINVESAPILSRRHVPHLMSGPPDHRGENGSWGVIASKAGFTHPGTVVDGKNGNILVRHDEFWNVRKMHETNAPKQFSVLIHWFHTFSRVWIAMLYTLEARVKSTFFKQLENNRFLTLNALINIECVAKSPLILIVLLEKYI